MRDELAQGSSNERGMTDSSQGRLMEHGMTDATPAGTEPAGLLGDASANAASTQRAPGLLNQVKSNRCSKGERYPEQNS